MTFDDRNVKNWLTAQKMFRAYGARVTFCVSKLHACSDDDVLGLHKLQDDGHEIAFHSRNHKYLPDFLKQNSIRDYIDQEIDHGVLEHKAAGFPAASFACPYHYSTRESRKACVDRFSVVRAKKPFYRLEAPIQNRVYTTPRQLVNNIASLDFRRKDHLGWDWTRLVLDKIEELKGAGVFVGHSIIEKPTDAGNFSTLGDLDQFLDEVTLRGIDFVRLSDMNSESVMTGTA